MASSFRSVVVVGLVALTLRTGIRSQAPAEGGKAQSGRAPEGDRKAGEAQAKLREQILAELAAPDRKNILAVKGVNAKNWGEDIVNPFTNLTEEGKAKLQAKGVDVQRLAKLPARLLTGEYCGANSKIFINKDPDTILVFGKGFKTHRDIYSFGPILAVEDADFMGVDVLGADLVWFVESVEKLRLPERKTGLPVIVAAEDGDYGWRRAKNFLQPLFKEPGAKPNLSAIADLAAKKKKLHELLAAATGVAITAVAEKTANPFTNLTDEGKAKLKLRGIDVERLARFQARLLTGSHRGAAKLFLNKDADTILILGKDFNTDGPICSAGPVLAMENAQFSGQVVSADLIWIVEKAFPRCELMGLPVILSPTSEYSQMVPMTEDVWRGDYGWRPPKAGTKPGPNDRRPK
jgi:hypothetical protein